MSKKWSLSTKLKTYRKSYKLLFIIHTAYRFQEHNYLNTEDPYYNADHNRLDTLLTSAVQ